MGDARRHGGGAAAKTRSSSTYGRREAWCAGNGVRGRGKVGCREAGCLGVGGAPWARHDRSLRRKGGHGTRGFGRIGMALRVGAWKADAEISIGRGWRAKEKSDMEEL
eukprot:5963674-Pleurochrysis_carterae.AAC.1